jgi:hypothetical protein
MRLSLGRYSSLADSGHGGFLFFFSTESEEWEQRGTAEDVLQRATARREKLLDGVMETGNLAIPDAHLLQNQFSSCSQCRHPHCKTLPLQPQFEVV